jgi:hypothetical protein
LAISAALLGLLFLMAPYLEAQEDIQFNQAGLSAVDPSDAPPFISPFADPHGPDTWPHETRGR